MAAEDRDKAHECRQRSSNAKGWNPKNPWRRSGEEVGGKRPCGIKLGMGGG